MRAMKEVMPNKLLTLYDFGHNLYNGVTDEHGKGAKNYLDYSWSDYGRNQTSFVGLPNEKYGKMSVNATYGTYGVGWAAEANVRDCFGMMMIYNIKGNSIAAGRVTEDLSAATKKLYGEECIFSGKYHKGHKDR